MPRYGLYDLSRGLTTAFAAGLAGLLLWCATLVGQQTTARFWEEMGVVAAAGLVLALSHVVGGWSKGLKLRLSPGTLVLGFLPLLVCVGWVLMATQPGSGWHEARIVAWSHDAGLMGIVHSLGLWHGVLAFGFGLVLGMSFDAMPVPVPVPADDVVVDRRAADEPLTAERTIPPRTGLRDRVTSIGPRTGA